MAMSIKNEEVEALAERLSRLTNTSKTEVIRQSLREKMQRLTLASAAPGAGRLTAFLEQRLWPTLPKGASRRWTKEEEEAALGYGPHGEPL